MSKIKTNYKFRMVAKMLKDIDKAKEVFIESPIHNQMIKYPASMYNSYDNLLQIITLGDFGDYTIDLDKFFVIQADRNEESFTYWIEFLDRSQIVISNEW